MGIICTPWKHFVARNAICVPADVCHLADGFRFDGRPWKVNWADTEDFHFFGWKWFENNARCVLLWCCCCPTSLVHR
jgi:hypothetical protein